jgi:hypothetical protein
MPSFLVATDSMGELELTHASGSSKQAWHIHDTVCTVFEFLMMGGETAWNMYSIDNNKRILYNVACFWLYLKELTKNLVAVVILKQRETSSL